LLAPGSQNGFDNSGNYGAIEWTQGNTVAHTLKTLNKIRKDYGQHSAVATIEALNEPMGPSLDVETIKQFYNDAWGNVVSNGKGMALTIHDAFEGPDAWNDWGDGMWWTMVDTHHYEVFESDLLSMSPSDHVSSACSFGGDMRNSNKWTIAGEWTGALTDCAKWLNGLAKGARYDGTFEGSSYIGSCDGKYEGTVAGLSDDDKTNIRQFIEAQLDAYESAAGWIFWTWKTESAPEWNMKELLANGLFPQPLSDRQCKSFLFSSSIRTKC
jgi:glucan 1,3-beta-glucosidase